MIKEINKEDIELINKIESLFPYFFSTTKIINDFQQNPYTKYFIYMEKSNIIGVVNYYDLIDRFELVYIEVLSDYQNKKIGSLLLENLIKIGEKNKINNITLEVRVNNDKALGLYKKYNFNVVATRKNYYDGLDGYLMERKMM